MESGAQEALDKRNEGEGPLVVEQYESQAKLDAVKAQIQENKVHQEKLKNYQKMKQLHPERKGSSYLRDNLKQNLKKVKEEVKLAKEFLKRTTKKPVVRANDLFFIIF